MTEDRQDSLSFLDPGVTPEKTRLLVRQIFRSTTETTDLETKLNNLSFLCGVACSYLLDYAKRSEPESSAQEESSTDAVKNPDCVSDLALARSMYEQYTDNHPTIHSNRFPSWQELTPNGRAEWHIKAREAGRNGAG